MLAIGETMSITKLHEHFSKTPHNTKPRKDAVLRLVFSGLFADLCSAIM